MIKLLAALCVWLMAWIGTAAAQYVVVLKNGRQLTVRSYRVEGATIKIFGLGGELGIPKNQVLSISKAGEGPRPGLNIIELESAARKERAPASSAPAETGKDTGVSEETEPELEEAAAYQKKLAEITQQLETAKAEYFKATQGGGTASNLTKEGIRAWTMDLASRIHDSQKVRGGGGPDSTPPTPPYAPSYTATEKKLSNLRAEIDALQKQRDALIEEMKSKNIPIPS